MEGILKRDDISKKTDWIINLNGNELERVKQHLKMSDVEKSKTIISAAKILGQCPNPKGEKNQRIGLAIGKVQSGKTSNFISLAALAIDNGYQIVIIFGGNTIPLLLQTEQRINESFDLNTREDFKFATFSSTNHLDSNCLKSNYEARKKIIITGLKEHTHIKNIKNFIKSAGLSDIPMLIIDDEGDQMSLNGSVNKGNETTTYRNFKEMLIDLNFSAFISVTATPQANLLIDICDILSPDFIELIKPGDNYSGFETFHSEPQTKYISIIPDKENVILDENSGIPESFEKSISTFYVGSIIKKRRGDYSNHSMLIHPSHKNIDHSIVGKKLNILLNQLKDYIESNEDSAKNIIISFLAKGIEELSSTVYEKYEAKELYDDFKSEIYNTSIQVLNRTNTITEIDYKSNRNVIVLGGKMVERGLTIKNLAVTYIVRTNKGKENADTVEQRTRWFGYRINKYGSYLDLCKIFLTEQMAKNFYNLGQHEKSIWNNILYSQKQGIIAKKMPLLFELDSHFNPTRRNVIADVSKFEFNKWIQQKAINSMVNKKDYEEVNNAITNFLKEYKYEEIKIGNFIHLLYRNVDFKMLYYEIISKYYSHSEDRFDIDYVRAAMQRLEIEKMPILINVIKMRNGIDEYHEVYEDNTIHNLMAGASVGRTEDDKQYYPGDANILPGEIQLQIHNTKIDKHSSDTRPLISFYCPYIGSAKRLVGKL